MKYLLVGFFICIGSMAMSQVPALINYQGIARDGSGKPLSAQHISLKLRILPTADAINAEYEEIQEVTTNEFGLYTIQIGNGTPLIGQMKAVKWETGNKYIHVAIDPFGANQYIDIGTTQLLSVPYALYAEKAGAGIETTNNHTRTGNVSSNAAHVAGDVNYIPKFTALNTIGKSLLFDNGNSIGLGTTTPAVGTKMHLLTTTGNIEHIRMQNNNSTGFGKFIMYNDNASNYATFTKYGSAFPGGYPSVASQYPFANMLAFGNNVGPFILANNGNVGIGIVTGGTTNLKFNAHQSTGYLGLGGSFIPAANVHINNSSTGDTLRITNATTGHLNTDGLEIRTTGNTATIMNKENSTFSIGTNNVNRVTIDALGRMGVGTNTPENAAILELKDSTKGFLMPRMTTSQRDLIVSPVVGLQIMNLDDQCIDMYDGSNWIKTCGMKVIGFATDLAHPTPDSWAQKASLPGALLSTISEAAGFAIDGKGYLGTGYFQQFNAPSNLFFQYDTLNNAWTQKANFAGGARLGAVGFAMNNEGYIGTGYDGTYKRDLWKYNPLSNTWTQMPLLPGASRLKAVGFSAGNKGYIGTGEDSVGNNLNDMWEFNGSWTQVSNFAGGIRSKATAFAINDKGYVGTGFDGSNFYNDLWEYNTTNNTWLQLASLPGAVRMNASSFAIGDKGYIGIGIENGNEFSDFWEYNIQNNLWTQKANFTGLNRDAAVGFSIGNKGYFATGSNTAHLWEYMDNNVTGIAYSMNDIPAIGNSITDGAWTLAHNTVYSSHTGKVGIGTSFPTSKLSVNGTADKPGGGSWGTFSDMRLKKEVTAYQEGLSEILKIKPVRYHYNELSGFDSQPEYVGIIAQELQKISPAMVSTFERNGQEYLKVDNSAMTYMLINAVKEQQQMINDLQSMVEAQQKMNEEYRKRIETLEKK